MIKIKETISRLKLSAYRLLQRNSSYFNTQKIILSVFILSAIYLAFSLIYPLFGLNNIHLPQGQIIPTQAAESEIMEAQEKPYESYATDIKDRQLFTAPAAGTQKDTVPGAAGTDLTKDLVLLGILSGDNPQAVIEDKKIQKTFYLNTGSFIGELRVKDIQDGKVTLEYNGREFELNL